MDWITESNSTKVQPIFSERQTSSSQPSNPQKELKSKEVRAAETKQNSQLERYMQKP